MTEFILPVAFSDSMMRRRAIHTLSTVILGCAIGAIAGCGTLPVARVDGHLKTEIRDPARPDAATKGNVPQTVRQVPLPPPPQARIDEVKYSIVVENIPVRELLFIFHSLLL